MLKIPLAIVPPLSKLTRKEEAMSKKSKPRTLGAEPLEKRVPVSSFATGVLWEVILDYFGNWSATVSFTFPGHFAIYSNDPFYTENGNFFCRS